MKKEEIRGTNPTDFVNAINTGATVFNAVFPLIKEGFTKLAELIRAVNKDKLGTPAGKRQAIETLIEQVSVLQAQNQLQKKWNSALLATLKEHNIEIDDNGEAE